MKIKRKLPHFNVPDTFNPTLPLQLRSFASWCNTGASLHALLTMPAMARQACMLRLRVSHLFAIAYHTCLLVYQVPDTWYTTAIRTRTCDEYDVQAVRTY